MSVHFKLLKVFAGGENRGLFLLVPASVFDFDGATHDVPHEITFDSV